MRSNRLFQNDAILKVGLCAWLLLWLFIKYELYWGLHYSSDLFLHLQISKSFYLGRGLFYDNIFAPHSYIHSYFLLLLLAPYSFTLGAFGLPVAYLATLAGAVYACVAVSKRDVSLRLSLLAITVGPVSFWLFDDPSYGFHTELLFVPLGILLAVTLQRHSKLFYFVAALIVLNREDGAIIGCAIHTCFLISQSALTKKYISHVFKVVCAWAMIFFLGMLILKVFGDGAGNRQAKALAMIGSVIQDLELRSAFLEMLYGTLLLLLPALLLLVLRSSFRAIAALFVCTLPVIAVTIIASFAYLPDVATFHFHGTSWPYRFGMLWALLAATILFSEPTSIGRSKILTVVVVGLSLYGQDYMLKKVRDYSVLERMTITKHPRDSLSIKEQVTLNCLSTLLPKDTSITTSGPFTVYFSHLDWSYGGNNPHMWEPAEVIVCDEGKFGHNNLCREEYASRPDSDWTKRKVQGVMIAFKKKNKPVNRFVKACL